MGFLRFAFLAVLAITGIIGVSGQGCEGDIQCMIKKCAKAVVPGPFLIKPSPDCCEFVDKLDVPFVCKLITKKLEKIISPRKVVYVAKYCGNPLAPRSKCGTYTVPPVF